MKYKVLGIFVVFFVFIMGFLFLFPEKGIDFFELGSNNIDSILIKTEGKTITVKEKSAIDTIVKYVEKATEVKIDRENVNTRKKFGAQQSKENDRKLA
jgi:hypothetical protein